MTANEEAWGSCSSYVTSALGTALFDHGSLSAVLDDSEQVYPGLKTLVQQIAAELQAAAVTADSFACDITHYAPDSRSYCGDLLK